MKDAPTPEKVAELEACARADYAAVDGKLLWIEHVTAYNSEDDTVDLTLDPPGLFRVESTSADSLAHWNYGWLDPYWELTLVGTHPDLAGLRSFFTHGPSYCLDGSVERGTWKIARIPFWRRVLLRLRRGGVR